MFCSNCGESVPEGKAFCRYCGAPVGDTVVLKPAPSEAFPEVEGPGWDQAATVVAPDAAES